MSNAEELVLSRIKRTAPLGADKPDYRTLPIDRIVRVSRIGPRDVGSEKFMTEKQQIEQIELTLNARGLIPGELFISHDESGHDWEDERDKLALALERIRNGESAGIAVAYFSRFARTAGEAIMAIKELHDRGAVFISCEDGLDSSTDSGRIMLGVMALFAELEWNRLAQSWSDTIETVIEQGRYIAGAIPVGYGVDASGRLDPDPEDGPVIARLFELRREGVSWRKLADWLTDQGVQPNTVKMTERTRADKPARAERYGEDGWQRWSVSSVQSIIKNPAYMGWARQLRKEREPVLNKNAHPALVSEELWHAVQQAETAPENKRTGAMSGMTMLKGRVFCAACGHRMIITGRPSKNGRVPLYYCQGRYSTGDCIAAGAVDAIKLDNYVSSLMLSIAGHVESTKATTIDTAELDRLSAIFEKADEEFAYWVRGGSELRADVGEKFYREEIRRLRQQRDEAEENLNLARTRAHSLGEIASGRMLELWPELTIEQRRPILAGLVNRVVVKSAEGKRGRGAPPIEQRVVEIEWFDGQRHPAPLAAVS